MNINVTFRKSAKYIDIVIDHIYNSIIVINKQIKTYSKTDLTPVSGENRNKYL